MLVICIVAAVGRGGVAAVRPAAEQRGDGRRPAFKPGTYLCSQFSHARPIATGVEGPGCEASLTHSPTRSLGHWLADWDGLCSQDWLSQSQCECLYVYVLLCVCLCLCVSVCVAVCLCLSLSVFVYWPVLFRPKLTWPDLCLLLAISCPLGGTWGHTLSAETELERPRGRRSPAVAAVVAKKQELQPSVCTGTVAYASRWIAGEERRLDWAVTEWPDRLTDCLTA